MNTPLRRIVACAILLLCTSTAWADLIIYDISSTTSRTLLGLGTKFVIGCTILALGMILSATISRKK